MRGVSIRSAVIAAVAAVTIPFAASVAEADPVTYSYVGNNFNFCGFGCPDNLPDGVTVTPVGEEEVVVTDYIIASLTFADALPFNPLDPNHVYTQSELPAILAWSIGDASGAVSLSGTTFGPFQPLLDDGQLITFPPLSLSTDANGNIVNYLMAVHVAPHLVIIANPPLTFEEDEGQFSVADALTAFYAADPGGSEENEFDLFGSTPGRWTRVTTGPNPQPVPEPGTLLLLSSGVVLLGGSRFRARRR
jgi:hypothetical protein